MIRRPPGSTLFPTRRSSDLFKVLGVERLLSASAVGSLKHEYKPLDIVVPDQFFDRTRGRISTFFGRGLVDRKSTRLNSSHVEISYAVFCLKKKTIECLVGFT